MTSVAIDGPAGAGKSTVARAISREMSFVYVDTGALYRAIGLYMIKNRIDGDESIVSYLNKVKVDLKFVDNEQKIFLCGEEVSGEIRTPEVSMMASRVSAILAVREFLLDLQRDLAKKNNVIMDGRDIGTVILPDADVKIFLTASLEKRAQRRYKEMLEKGLNVTYDGILSDIKKRDYDDSHRKVAPLKPAADAILVDTSDYNLEESIKLVLDVIRKKLN